jgi:hypothetical protein
MKMTVDAKSSSTKEGEQANHTESKDKKHFSFKIPQFSNSKKNPTKVKLDIKIKREPKRTHQEYLAILKRLDILLNSHSISDAQRRDYCKSQRYFMKLYLKKMRELNHS